MNQTILRELKKLVGKDVIIKGNTLSCLSIPQSFSDSDPNGKLKSIDDDCLHIESNYGGNKFYVYYDFPLKNVIHSENAITGKPQTGLSEAGLDTLAKDAVSEYKQIYKVINNINVRQQIEILGQDDLIKLNKFYKKYNKGK